MATRRSTTASKTKSKRTSTKRAPAKKATPPPVPVAGSGERIFMLDIPFRESAPGAQWVKQWKSSVYVGAHLPDALRPYASRPYTYARWVEDAINVAPSTDRHAVAAKRPRPAQIEAATDIARRAAAGGRGFALTEDPGNGKTISAVLAAKAIAKMRGVDAVLVLADRPASITIRHWADTIASVGDGGLKWLVTTLDRLPSLIARNGRPRWKFDIVVTDESHNYRHQDTKRVEAYWRVARYTDPHTAAPFVLHLTATPGHNVAEQTYLAPILAQIHNEPTVAWTDFGERLHAAGFHVARNNFGHWDWDKTAKADARIQQGDSTRLNHLLSQATPPALRYRPAPQGPVPLDGLAVHLDFAQRLAYEAEWGEFVTQMSLARRGANTARGRALLLRYRQKAGMIRVPQTVEWVRAQVASGVQVALSTEFVETAADPLREALEDHGIPVACLYGTGRFDEERERLRFQRGRAPVVVFTKTASISLHAGEQLADGSHATDVPRVGAFHQARFSGIAGRQITGRTHRDGKVSPWWVLFAEDTKEETAGRVMVERIAAAAATAGGDVASMAAIAALFGADWLPAEALTGE